MTLNEIESTWENGPVASRLIASRDDAFDFRAGLFHAPLRWRWEALSHDVVAIPSAEWSRDALESFVRDEFGSRTTSRPMPESLPRSTVTCSLRETAQRHQAWAERRFVYDPQAQARLAALVLSEPEPRRRLYELLVSAPIGARENRKNITATEFGEKILPSVDLRVGARLIAMGLPFRDQNPFRTDDSPHAPTLAEAAFLIQMHTTALALYQVFPSGSTVTIIADGRFYAKTLGTSEDAASAYLHNLRRLRNDLNMQGTVSLIDLQDVVDRFSRRTMDLNLFNNTVASVEDHLRDAVAEGGVHEQLMRSVALGMRWNYATRDLSVGVGRRELWEWMHGSSPPAGALADLNELVDAAAITYAAQNLALRFHAVVPTMLPGFIRASVHPKHLQVGLARNGSISPWNGVAYMKDGTPQSLRSMPLHEVPAQATEYRSSDYVDNSIVFYA